jgi:hypothetical protein
MRVWAVSVVAMVAALSAFGQKEPENLALKKPVTVVGGIGQGAADLLTDGITASDPYLGGPTEVQIDFQKTYKVTTIKIWHYWADGRTYHDNKIALSTKSLFQGEETVVFDSKRDGEYPETAAGKTITFPEVEARYLHAWVGGNTVNQWSHWVEIQAFYIPVARSVGARGKLAVTWGAVKTR